VAKACQTIIAKTQAAAASIPATTTTRREDERAVTMRIYHIQGATADVQLRFFDEWLQAHDNALTGSLKRPDLRAPCDSPVKA
jgi:hypothetical protein